MDILYIRQDASIQTSSCAANDYNDNMDNQRALKIKKSKAFETTLDFLDNMLVAREGFEPPTLRV